MSRSVGAGSSGAGLYRKWLGMIPLVSLPNQLHSGPKMTVGRACPIRTDLS